MSEAFVKNGMRHALRVLGQPESAADPANWEYDCYVNPKLQQVLRGGRKVHVECASGVVCGGGTREDSSNLPVVQS